jgi:hypothetical protein
LDLSQRDRIERVLLEQRPPLDVLLSVPEKSPVRSKGTPSGGGVARRLKFARIA